MNNNKKVFVLILAVLAFAFIADTIFWCVYKQQRYGSFVEFTDGENGIEKDGYIFTTFAPTRFLHYRGNLSVTEVIHVDEQTGKIAGVTCDLQIFPKLFGGYDFYASIMDNNTGTLPEGKDAVNMHISQDAELLEGDEELKAFYEQYKDLIKKAMEAAKSNFDL